MIVEHRPARTSSRTLDDIRIDAISENEWRVCDRRIPLDDARSLLGFIERTHGTFEVMEFSDPVRFSFCTCLDDALARFVHATAVQNTAVMNTAGQDAAILRFPRPRPAA